MPILQGERKAMMTTGDQRDIQLFVKGEIRSDGWISDWRIDLERRRKEDLGKRKFVTAPQIIARQARTRVTRPTPKPRVKAVPRTCEVCSTVIKTDNKTGRCIHHQSKRIQKVKSLCPRCETPMRAHNKFGICTGCYQKYRRLISQEVIKMCDECPAQLRSNNITGKCMKHAYSVHRRTENASRRAKYKALRATNFQVAA